MLNLNTFWKRIIATIIMFAIIFSNSAVLLDQAVSYAAVGKYGKAQNVDSVENIEFDSTIMDNGEVKGYEYQTSMDNENLSIKLSVGIKDAGYLKNASIEFKSSSKLNFEIGEIENNNLVESRVGENIIKLNQINSNEPLELTIPITYKETETVDNLKNDTYVVLSGEYVDNEGNLVNVNKEVVMSLSWLSNSKVTISSNLSKFVKYSADDKKGLIAQTLVTIGLDKENMPIANTEVNIDALQIENMNIEKVTVISNDRLNFNQSNWNYDDINKKINITVDNNEVVENTETFVITYVFSGNVPKFPLELNSNITSNISLNGTSEKISGEFSALYTISEEVGDIVTYSAEILEDNLSKGNILANTYDKNNNYVFEYGYKYLINIADTSLIDNIVLKDIDENFVSKEDKEYSLNEVSYYKDIKVSEADFTNILGENGMIEIFDEKGKKVSDITKNAEKTDDGYYILDLTSNNLSKITIKTSKAQAAGNIEIIVDKEIQKTEYNISEIRSFNTIKNKVSGSIIFEGDVENKIGNNEVTLNLKDTETTANLLINKSSLGTIVKNEDVELKVEFNNNKVGTDFYKNPVFEIVLPEGIKEVTINKVSVINADNAFTIKNITARKLDSNIVIKVELTGTQKGYSLNNLTNGTNLLIDTDMVLDVFAPSEEKEITLNYINEDATSYNNENTDYGTAKTKVTYTAPSGLVSVNTISSYNDKGSRVTSVMQGTVTDKIEIYNDSKVSTMDILVMNNNDNIVKDVKILGRIPFKGNTDVTTGEDLGTTLDTNMINGVIASTNNKVIAKVYYSENGNATADLNNTQNGWVSEVKDFSKIKSYLIVCDETYEMNPGEILEFNYQYRIPANLEHNEELYGSFATYYTNVTDVAIKEDVSQADKVGLITGQGPQLSLETSVNIGTEDVNEYEYIKYSVTVKNTGEENAEDVKINVPLPKGTTFATYIPTTSVENLGGWSLDTNKEKTYNVGTLKPNEEKTYEFDVQVNKLPTIEEYYGKYEGFTKNEDGSYSLIEKIEDENGEVTYKETKLDSVPDVYTEFVATVTAKDLAKPLTSNTTKNKVIESDVILSEMVKTETVVVNVNEEMTYEVTLKNTTEQDMKDIKIEKILPELVKYKEAYVVGHEEDGITLKKINSVSYDESSRKLVWTVKSLEAGRTVHVKLVVDTTDLPEGKYEDEIVTSSTVKVNGEEYKTGEISTTIGKPKLVISQTSDVTNKYVTEGQVINYKFTIKNEGLVKAKSVSVVDNLPDKVKIKSLSYVSDGIEMKKVVSNNEDATVYTSIQPNSELIINVKAVTLAVPEDMTIENYATVEAKNDPETKKTNTVTHIIEKSENIKEENNNNGGNNQNKPNDVETENNQETRTYKITGSAWLDTDKDAKYTKNDRMISNLEVILVNATTGKQIDRTQTSTTGVYSFDGLSKGKYYVGFYYNPNKYGLTEYKRDGVEENLNSDAYASELDGRVIGLTDTITISNTSISNIDVGLIEADIFDLSLDKKVTKITVQNDKGTKKTNFDTDLAKIDIRANELSSSKVYIEYKFVIKNEGELIGYAKQIADFKDQGLTFSQDLNAGWYEGSDGNLYNETLANKAINPGDSVELKLVLTKQMTEENTGIVNNTAEITKAYNAAGVADRDSTPNNRVQTEDDYGVADVIISVHTGETLIYMSAIITISILSIIAIYILTKNRYKIRKVLSKRKVVD